MPDNHPTAPQAASPGNRLPPGWEAPLSADLSLPAGSLPVVVKLLGACLACPEVHYVSVDAADDAPALRVWVTAFTAYTQQELDRLQAAHPGAVIIAMRLPPGEEVPSVGPGETLFRRCG